MKKSIKQFIDVCKAFFELFTIIIVILSMIGCFVAFVYIAVTNIDSTEMRLLVDYWYVYLIAVVVLITDISIINKFADRYR